MHSPRPFLLLVSAAIVCSASVDPATLLSSVRSKIRENAGSMPRYYAGKGSSARTSHTWWLRGSSPVRKQSGCGVLPEQGIPKVSILRLASTDRPRSDVMLARGKELFSWPGERCFGT
jgi:hypothetical protein